jgi:CheY-like chemotaxis protein
MKNRHILLVEDDTDDQMLFQQALQDVAPSAACTIASNGRDALLRLNSLRPDVIFADINMPLLNGLELLKELKRLALNIPIVMMSTASHEEQNVRSLGAEHFFLKPSMYDTLCSQLAYFLALALGERMPVLNQS